ncbi:CHAT domain-containing protein [Candidatus Viridilinea mediisalina]|uniref:NACHT domain-containing protein n=1 Tax=Candidatus Viridilinea mediisalina TaxID=2024553 RepID=A0A2A6RDL7_9CHLR|nr:CHAT domain-containing protein [Candidatus Viridilinea mediisalina]PDW00638.1 hypothetical protein CJ255_20405 [Candidatus Viridilinea mediisalina]
MSQFEDMLVRVQRATQAGQAVHYTVELWLQGGRRLQSQAELALADFIEPTPGSPQAVAVGFDLFNRLFSGPLAVAFQQAWAALNARGRTLRLRLALDPAAPELHAIPWELMYFDDSGGLAPPRPLAIDARVAFSRYIESARFDEGQPVAERPVRLLLAIATPNDLPRWNLAELDRAAEERDFRTRFSAVVASGQFRCDVLPTTTAPMLQESLQRGTLEQQSARGYDVLLYLGHGLHHAELGTRLVLEHPANGHVALYDGAELIDFLKQLPASHRPVLIILVACNSAVAGTLNSLAARLLTDAGVPAVLAMQRLVEIGLARSFTHQLSEHLLRDGVIDRAVNMARRWVFQAEDLGWSTPVLYMRNAEGRLFSPNAQLEYVSQVLRDPAFARWGGAEYIEVGVLAVAPGQDWNLLRARPEDAPAVVGALEALDRALGMGLRPLRRRDEQEGRRTTNLAALIGPPQSGQTTVLRRLAYELAEATTNDVSRPLGIFLSLTGYEQLRGPRRLERYIIEQARTEVPSLAEQLTSIFRPDTTQRDAHAGPHFIFLLDNLDEIPDRHRIDLARELHMLATRLPQQRFIVTSAEDSFPGQIMSRAQVFVIQMLNEHQILRYLRQRDERIALRIFQQIRANRLLKLAGDPSLLALIYELLASDAQAVLTRNQLVQDYLDRMLATIDPRYSQGDAAREGLIALAWYSRWNHREQIPLRDLFRILGQVRRQRDYSLEELYAMLRQARLLTGVGQHAARFVNPLLHAYCAAVALSQSAAANRLPDIIAMCANPELLSWWEDVLYALAGLLSNPTLLFEQLAAATRAGGNTHALLAARCLEASPKAQEDDLPPALRSELLDACVLRLRSEREPSAERREQIVAALGRLSYQQVRHELRRILVEKVRPSFHGMRYEYTNVRIAAARALRNIYLLPMGATPAPAPEPGQPLVLTRYEDEVTLHDRSSTRPHAEPATHQAHADDAMLERMMHIWLKGTDGRAEFRDLLRNSTSAPERALAAFALGDMVDEPGQKLLDARQLLRVILSPVDQEEHEIDEDWQDTMWAAADALTLFDPEQVAPLLTVLISRNEAIPDSAAQQLAYVAGRVRANNPEVIDWLIRLLVTNPSQSLKAKALQSLAWMGMGIPSVRLRLSDGRNGPTLKTIIQHIAAGRPIHGLQLGSFDVRLREDDPPDTPLYLRRKAIEALAWIGDVATLRDLGTSFQHWPIELREQWYVAAATIKRRLDVG